jgi:hypothetical protein
VVPPTNVFYQMKSRDTFAPIGPYIVTDRRRASPLQDGRSMSIAALGDGGQSNGEAASSLRVVSDVPGVSSCDLPDQR